MVIIETSVFTRLIKEFLDDDNYAELQEVLIKKPDLGSLIPGSAGLRKIRWGLEGQGKRGGLRIIYYWQISDEQIWMLYVYQKVDKDDLTWNQIKTLRGIVRGWSK